MESKVPYELTLLQVSIITTALLTYMEQYGSYLPGMVMDNIEILIGDLSDE